MKTLITALFFCAITINLFAQDNRFVGKWALEGTPPDPEQSRWKVFTASGEFYNQRNIKNLQIRTHRGTYEIKDKGTYQETVATTTNPMMAHLSGQITTINYRFSEDGNKLYLEGLATNGNLNWSEVWNKMDSGHLSKSNLPQNFQIALAEAKMSFVIPEGTVEIPVIENKQMHYEYAVKHKEYPLEIRYSIAPLGKRMKQALQQNKNGKNPEEIRKKENESSKVIAYAVALNVAGGVMDTTIRSKYFPPGSVKLEFGADWGTTTLVNLKNNSFGTEYKCCMMVTLHRDDLGDAYIFYLSDTKEILLEAITKTIAKNGSFYALKFDE